MAKLPETTVNVNEVSRISSGTIIKGEIISPNDIRIDGNFEGKISSKGRVVIGDKAVINGDIICENVDYGERLQEACMSGTPSLSRKAARSTETFTSGGW